MSAGDDIKKRLKQLKAIRDEVLKDLLDVGKDAADLIRKRTKLGFGVESQGGKKKKLKKLSEPYKASRKRTKPKGNTTAAKSNLTHSGEMLDSLEAKKTSKGSVEIGFSNTDSEDKAGWVSDDRPFNNLSKSEIKQLKQKLAKSIESAINKKG